MADLADLHNSTVSAASPELHEAVVLDDAVERRQEIRCVVPSFGDGYASDPMGWNPYTTAEGEFWPKEGDRAVLSFAPDGPPVIQWWEPSAPREPSIAGSGVQVIVHGSDPEVHRGSAPGIRIWIGSVVPEEMLDNDLLAKYP